MNETVRVIELFAGVGGFRIGLEGASDCFHTIWSNQWEPSTKHQDASIIYQARFGSNGHTNKDVCSITTCDIPDHDLLVGGFPCQDYSVASTLSKSGGIEGTKGILWWQIHRILKEKGDKAPAYLFLENVDRLLISPAAQRGRDFAVILVSLADLGYTVEWRVINAADYGMPQRRRRTYILAYKEGSKIANSIENLREWVLFDGVLASQFPFLKKENTLSEFTITGSTIDVFNDFNKGKKASPFKSAGIMMKRKVLTMDTIPLYNGPIQTLGDILIDESFVPQEYFIDDSELPKWKYEKGAKSIKRVSKEGYEYNFTEGGMAFPDDLSKPSRTIITGEGGAAPSRFKHIIQTSSGKYRRLMPIELERLNMFPDNHTMHPDVSEGKRAFLMGNALVCGIVELVGKSLYRHMFLKEPVSTHPIYQKRDRQPMLDFSIFSKKLDIFNIKIPKKSFTPQPNKNLLIGYVKPDIQNYFLDLQPTKIYYTGKTKSFPSTIALNKLFYFMPYIKGKGVRDLYIIRKARIGNKAEINKGSKDIESRLVFELEYIESLPDYKPIRLNIYNTYTSTLLGRVFDSQQND